MKQPKTGNIDYSQINNSPEEHEIRVARYFARRGKSITFIRPSNIPKIGGVIRADAALQELSGADADILPIVLTPLYFLKHFSLIQNKLIHI